MTTRYTHFSLAVLLTLTSGPVFAEHEGPDAHAHHKTQTITLDTRDVRPASTTMEHGDVLSFVNYSTNPMRVTFTEPKDLEAKIRCGLVRDAKAKGTPAAPWALFVWNDGKLVANVPPGQFASVCALAPGQYAFTSETVGQQRPSGVLPAKGQIEVK